MYGKHMKALVSAKNNLISLLDKTFPGANDFFDSPTRDDGHQNWVDFVAHFWHCEIVVSLTREAFSERYKKWCKRNGYKFSASKAETIHANAIEFCPTRLKINALNFS